MLDYRDIVKNYIKDYMQVDFVSFVADNSVSFLKVLTVRVRKNDDLYDVVFMYDDLNKKDLIIQEVREVVNYE